MVLNTNVLPDLGLTLLQIALVFVVLFVAKLYRAWYTKNVDDFALMQEHNVSSAGISMTGFLAGMTIIIALAFGGESHGLENDIMAILFTAFIGMILMSFNGFFVDSLILAGIKSGNKRIQEAINSNNLSIGIMQAFGFIAAAVQFYIANSGVEEITIGLFMVSVPYFLLGQLIVVAGMYGFILVSSYDDHHELFKGNSAVAMSHGFLMLAISIMVGTVSQQAQIVDLTTTFFIVAYSIISIILMIFIPRLMASSFLNGVLKIKYDGKIENATANGQVDIAMIYGIMRVVVAIVIASSLPFNLFIV